jgi:hypothetical protein
MVTILLINVSDKKNFGQKKFGQKNFGQKNFGQKKIRTNLLTVLMGKISSKTNICLAMLNKIFGFISKL